MQTEYAAQLAAIGQKIDRLMAALSESDDLSMPYINRTIQKLEKEREDLTAKHREAHARPAPTTLNFAALPFGQKKLVAAQFIQAVTPNRQPCGGGVARVSPLITKGQSRIDRPSFLVFIFLVRYDKILINF